ncbi:lysophospholipid acyltransferase family protein [Catenulispora sp. GP43]|uniref:lysophospholipid acyltransferase family protein n=1 Tax=Catenulispora sp. GP43 TaxID=3156263 RepID=UPI0035189A4E
MGLEAVPRSGPVVLIANHDSPLDALVIAVVGRLLDRLGQLPIERGTGDSAGLDAVVETLRAGECICVFPEGTLSRGTRQRIRSGAARLLSAVPDAALVCCAVIGSGAVSRSRFRGRAGVVFFKATQTEGSTASEIVVEAMDVIRTVAPRAS